MLVMISRLPPFLSCSPHRRPAPFAPARGDVRLMSTLWPKDYLKFMAHSGVHQMDISYAISHSARYRWIHISSKQRTVFIEKLIVVDLIDLSQINNEKGVHCMLKLKRLCRRE